MINQEIAVYVCNLEIKRYIGGEIELMCLPVGSMTRGEGSTED